MKLKMYDNVELNEEIDDLAQRGIHKGCTGIILDIKADICFVRFRNRKNMGDYACANVNQKYLEFYRHEAEEDIPTWERFKARGKYRNEFKINPYKEFDWIEILVEKEEYAKVGLHKGMYANVLFDYAIDDEIAVMFPDDDGYDVEVNVNLDDIKLHQRIPND